jgi:hypothetical protein
VLLSAAGLCSSAGNVLSAPASVPASITKGAPTSGQTAMAGTGGTPTSATVTATTNASKGSRNEIAFGLSGQYFICVSTTRATHISTWSDRYMIRLYLQLHYLIWYRSR